MPIREVDIHPINTPRYAIEIIINGAPMMAGLDTGSTGLRLLPRAAAHAGIAPDGPPESYSYGSGVELNGHRPDVDVAIARCADGRRSRPCSALRASHGGRTARHRAFRPATMA